MLRKLSLCQPIGKECCGTLGYDSACPACVAFAGLVRLADLTGSICLSPSQNLSAPVFLRNVSGVRSEHTETTLYGEVLAELLRVDRLPLQGVLNEMLRIPMNLSRWVVVRSKGERVSLRRMFSVGPVRIA